MPLRAAVPGDARALREGRALAKLAHPNVVSVFDVGVWSGGVFLAIELVDGTTVKNWASGRSSRDVVRAFVGLADGLAAAHRAGLVHRDIKPDNLVVDATGRARVIDFGLALEAAGSNATFGGTPAYLAPELRDAAVAGTPRSDQFALALSLHEVLAGARPPEKLPGNTPGWLARALARALSDHGDDRFATLDDFAHALRSGFGVCQRRIAIGAVIVSLAAIGAVAIVSRHGTAAMPCAPAVHAAALADTWNSTRRAQLRTAFTASQLPYAAAITTSVEAALDAYASGWAVARVDACEATNVRREQSAELLDLRMACLDQRRTELGALVDRFAHGDAAIVERSLAATSALPLLASCADGARLRKRLPLPRDVQTEVLLATLASGEQSIGVALETLNIGNVQSRLKLFRDALASYEQVQRVADLAIGSGNLYSAKALGGASTVYSHTGDLKKAWEAGEKAATMLEKAAGKDSIDVAMARSALADIAYRQNDPARAAAELEVSVRIHLATMGSDHPSTAREELLLADALWDVGRDRPRARKLAEAALPVFVASGNTGYVEETKAWLAHRPLSR